MENNNEDLVVEETTTEELVPETTVESETAEVTEEPETEEVTEEPETTEVTEEPETTEVTEEPETEEVTEESETEEDDLTDDEFADLEELLFWEEETSEDDETEEEDEEIIQPKFFKKDNEELSEEDLVELDETITALEEENNSFKEKIWTFEQEVNDLSSALDKIGEHPVLWPLATALLEWKELNIPDILKEKVKEEISSLPKETVSNEWIEIEKALNPLEKMALQWQWQANFLKWL